MNTAKTLSDNMAGRDWWRGAVIYQIYPRSFADANGDGVGDLRGITSRLPYVASLGVDAVWLSPIFKSPMKDFGYDVEDYRDIDPLFGSLADFDALLERAHALGLKVIIDQVLSHTADTHAWFKESRASRDNPRSDWYIWADAQPDGSPPNNWLSVFGGSSWQWDTRRCQYYLHNFLAAQPDLNLHNEAVQQQLLADVRFWLDRGVDGFRFDTTNYFFHDTELRANPAAEPRKGGLAAVPAKITNPYDMQAHVFDKNRPETVGFLQRLRALLDEYGAASVGEVGEADALATMIEYTAGSDRLHMTYSFSLLSRDNSVAHVRRQSEEFEAAASVAGGWPCWTLGNHDSTRLLTRWAGEKAPNDFTRMALALLLSLRGSACWYQGDELALPEADLPFEALRDPPGIAFWPEYKGRDGCRTPMPWVAQAVHAGFGTPADAPTWLPVPAEHAARAVDRCEADLDAPLHFMRAFVPWRRSLAALLHGTVRYLDAPEPVLALVRTPLPDAVGCTVLVLFNLSDQAVPVTLAQAPQSMTLPVPGLPAHQTAVRQGDSFTLPPYGIYFGAVCA
ncbi:MAG: alpha-glucosidase [Pseudomonadota bacterium]|jgi:alpha-glucosidase